MLTRNELSFGPRDVRAMEYCYQENDLTDKNSAQYWTVAVK